MAERERRKKAQEDRKRKIEEKKMRHVADGNCPGQSGCLYCIKARRAQTGAIIDLDADGDEVDAIELRQKVKRAPDIYIEISDDERGDED